MNLPACYHSLVSYVPAHVFHTCPFSNYYGQKGELKGCINDVHNIKNFLTKNFKIDEVLVLTDDQTDSSKIPTRKNILSAFRWLRDGVKAGDSLILHYSGHGGSIKDLDGDEEDGK